MATKIERSLDALLDEALTNTREDRERIKEAYEKMKEALNVKNEAKILAADHAIKLIENLNKNNDIIVKLAQIKEREESRKKEKKGKAAPFDIDEIKTFAEKDN